MHDLIFPHHENEIAQAEATHHNTIANYWIHNGMMNINNEKMSKSLGNIISAKDGIANYGADTIRLLLLNCQYRSVLNFTDETVNDTKATLEKLSNIWKQLNLKIAQNNGKLFGKSTMEIKTSPAAQLLMKAAGLTAGSPNPKTTKVGKVTKAQIREIAEYKMPDLNANDIDAAMNLMDGFGDIDDIDHLSNRRIRCVGELIQTQFRIGLTKMVKNVQQRMSITAGMEVKELTPQNLVNVRPVNTAIREFFASSQLSQFMDQTNPLAELSNKRRISSLGPGGLTRDRASMAVRDVHFSHYGRICPIETPEGQNIGLINNLSTYAKVDKYGFIETPYRRVDRNTGKILEEVDYLSADEENNHGGNFLK